jgi:hypothetical protein
MSERGTLENLQEVREGCWKTCTSERGMLENLQEVRERPEKTCRK